MGKPNRLQNDPHVTDVFARFGWSIDYPALALQEGLSGYVIRDLPGGVSYSADQDARILSIRGNPGLDQDFLRHVLLDLVLPRLLAAGDVIALHGALIESAGHGFGLIAASGHGKSTLGASFHGGDSRLLGDDALLLRPDGGGYRGQSLYPSLRLFPDSLARVLPGGVESAPVAGYTLKRRVPFGSGPDSTPLCALFRLADPGEEIRVTRLAPAAACMAIIGNAFALDPGDAGETRRRFARAAEAARVIPVFDLTYPRDYARLPGVQGAILSALDTLREEA